MRLVIIALLCLALAAPALAQKSQEKEFAAAPADVFDAALDLIKDQYTILETNREEGVLKFRREQGFKTISLRITFTVRKHENGKTIARVDAAKARALPVSAWGADSRFEKEFLEALEAELKKRAPAPAAAPSQ